MTGCKEKQAARALKFERLNRGQRLLSKARARERLYGVPEEYRIDVELWTPVVDWEITNGVWAPYYRFDRGAGNELSASLSRITRDRRYTDNFVVEPMFVNHMRGKSGEIEFDIDFHLMRLLLKAKYQKPLEV